MPRLPPSLVTLARSQHSLLPLLLRQTRSLPLARSELRWLREYVFQLPSSISSPALHRARRHHLKRLCYHRSLGAPLQYLLKTQPFGTVEILCGKGALIPRPETEGTVVKLFQTRRNGVAQEGYGLRVLDLCTGPGSIALLAASLLHDSGSPSGYRVLGVDISDRALRLAQQSLTYNIANGALPPAARQNVGFTKLDLLATDHSAALSTIASFFNHDFTSGREPESVVDIIIANPPYISPQGYWKDTSRSVRLYEPELALVPPPLPKPHGSDYLQEDSFYPAIESLATKLRAPGLVLETGGNDQSARVQHMLAQRNWETSIWTDFAGIHRNVVAWRGNGSWSWLGSLS
ncbi:hypothetical protein DRE_06466 [Drechslerella stenobrocha 248]|uniref:Type II methyltransferase M.TaqI-like domain-containing protein n=1 Tax=Drechslerella stenobrocha 248 TaxID=1043628 RepID=W7HY16_9PEZI|nr:hypothetical protein DRE_06466 [Drechslerella stenobrocha 248]